jgi:putative DNA primase/helicase
MVAQHHPRDAARDWMETLRWDGTERVRESLGRIFGAGDTSYVGAVSQNFWISLVARTYRPGCQCDNMVVIEGPQGYLKSTALSIIGGEWYAEQHESASNPRAFAEVLVGKLLIEISEMGSFGKAEANQIKRSISCRSDRFRAPYARSAADHPRRCVLAGTTNRDDWNRDDTGARRFWPIKCTRKADLRWLTDNREQLFAEAVALFRDNVTWWMVPADDAQREQQERFETDPWRDAISGWIVGREWTYVTEVASDCLRIAPQDRDMSTSRRITAVLRELGYCNGGVRRVDGKTVRAFMVAPDSGVELE